MLCEYDGSSSYYKKLFIYGNYIDEVLFTQSFSSPYTRKFYVHDHLYSPVALINYYSGQEVVERYEYDAYGACQILEPNFAPDPDGKSDYGNPYLFTGRRWDILDNGSLKIQYNRNRYYDYRTGRWLTQDPLGITPNSFDGFDPKGQYFDSVNLYEYVQSLPLILMDPYGNTPFSDWVWRQVGKHLLEKFKGWTMEEFGLFGMAKRKTIVSGPKVCPKDWKRRLQYKEVIKKKFQVRATRYWGPAENLSDKRKTSAPTLDEKIVKKTYVCVCGRYKWGLYITLEHNSDPSPWEENLRVEYFVGRIIGEVRKWKEVRLKWWGPKSGCAKIWDGT